jgi:hypothetical protein
MAGLGSGAMNCADSAPDHLGLPRDSAGIAASGNNVALGGLPGSDERSQLCAERYTYSGSPRSTSTASGVCSRTMLRAVPSGTRDGVSFDTSTMAPNASGMVQAAG